MAKAAPTSATNDLEAAFAGRRARVRRGRQTVAVVPVADLERLEELEAEEDRLLLGAALAAKAAAAASGEVAVAWADADRRLGEL